MNDMDAANILYNKLFFDFYYGQFIGNLPKIIMFNHGGIFVIGNERCEIHSMEEFEALLQEVIRTKTGHNSLFIKKTYDSYGGKNIYHISDEDFPLPAEQLKELYTNITRTGFLFQELIIMFVFKKMAYFPK